MNQKVKNKKILFADLDGTLIKIKSGNISPKDVWDIQFRFDVLNAIKKLNPDYILIISSKSGIEGEYFDANKFYSKSTYIKRVIGAYCGCSCGYHETNYVKDPYCKPNIVMLLSLISKHISNDLDFIKSKILMIGDESGKEGQFSDTDKKTAENFGIDYLDVEDFINKMI